MSPAMKNPETRPPEEPVAAPPPAPYTAAMGGDRNGPRGAWWREGLRSWIPMLAIGVTLLISIQSQLLGMQRQIGELRGEIGELRGEIGQIRGEMGELRGEMGNLRVEFRDLLRAELRREMAALRKDLEGQIGALREDVDELGERMTSLENVVETHLREHARPSSPREESGGPEAADYTD